MAFEFNQLVVHTNDQPRRHPLSDEVAPLLKPELARQRERLHTENDISCLTLNRT